MNQRAFKNQIRGLNEDESAYLNVLHQAKVNEACAKFEEEKKLFNELDWRGDGEIREKESPTVHHFETIFSCRGASPR